MIPVLAGLLGVALGATAVGWAMSNRLERVERRAEQAAEAAEAFQQELDEANAERERTECRGRRRMVAAACALYYASTAVSGSPSYPAAYDTPALYPDNEVPSCPGGGVWTYNPAIGRITQCSEHKD